ncbi:glycosyl hydrolase family 8 [Lactobacillus helveticus]|uniref:Glucanase n=1 Tax=Lactobacillus helveticus TaxID=1587 RepID=A0A8H9KHT1_LACHE|nr:glycosyl hydrolase family 8 [Lactobacillus helveticus]KRO08888.1 hypothetical protein IV62_GL001864 [Lactobacillus helveticus]MBW8062220.1 beta-glucanase [Lactobacillus helveticus]GFO99828.1 beta-glucanase [Lactobacillus helveticus]GFP01016.1 beta-glucanase [Lactobacillus helveticus]GFP03236.1 beta-glucanase [Lactobacillus helveticus]
MKRLKLLPWAFIGIITIFAAIMAYVRFDNSRQLRHRFYLQWRRDYVVKYKNDESFINTTPRTHKTMALSEGQGYGMYINVLAAKNGWGKENDFERLNNFYLAHRERIAGATTDLMSWRMIKKQGKWKVDKNSATDGDLFIAEALLKASKIWHNDQYTDEAHALINDILRYEYNPQTNTLTVGNWANSKSKFYNLMRTSDVMPEFFDDFYQETGDRRWLLIKKTMLKRLNQLSHQHKSGLVPDFAWVSKSNAKPIKANAVATKYDGDFSANACRVPMMLAQSNDPLAKNTLKRMMKFFSKQSTLTAGFTLEGKPLNKYQSASFSAPIFNAVSFNSNQGFDNLFMSQQYIFARPLPAKNYYDAALTTMAALEVEKI